MSIRDFSEGEGRRRRRTRSRSRSRSRVPSHRQLMNHENGATPNVTDDDGEIVDVGVSLDPEKKEWEDRTPVGRKELWSWYSFDWANSVYYNTVLQAFLPAFLLILAYNNEDSNHRVWFLPGIWMQGSSYYSSVVSLSVVIQLLAFVLLGVVGDYSHYRFRGMVLFSIIGSIATSCFGLVTPSFLQVTGFLIIVSNVCLGVSVIFYNAFLPILVRYHPEVQKHEGAVNYAAEETRMSQRISACGFLWGYAGGVSLLVVNTGIAVLASMFIGSYECNKWCYDCPSFLELDQLAIDANFNDSSNAWEPWKNVIQNYTLQTEGYAHAADLNGTMVAWPGRNPPCVNAYGKVDVAGVDYLHPNETMESHGSKIGQPLIFDYEDGWARARRHYCPRRRAGYCDEYGCRPYMLPGATVLKSRPAAGESVIGADQQRVTLDNATRALLKTDYPDWVVPDNRFFFPVGELNASEPIFLHVQREDPFAFDLSKDKLWWENGILMCSPRRDTQRCAVDYYADLQSQRARSEALAVAEQRSRQNGGEPVDFDSLPPLRYLCSVDETVGNVGDRRCPHFLCRRKECARGYQNVTDETTGRKGCDPNFTGSRINLSSGGLWWLGFSMIAFWGMRTRPGPPLTENPIKRSLRSYWKTFRKIKRIPNAFRFLLAYWLYSDGLATIGFGASQVATQAPLSFSGIQLGILLLEVNFSALVGSWVYVKVANGLLIWQRWRRTRQGKLSADEIAEADSAWTSKVIVIINISCMCLLPLWAIPGVGMVFPWELFTAAFIYGFQVGSMQAFSRSLLQHFTPPGMESEFFAFFELTDKGTSWLGPIVLAVANETLGNIRWGLFLIVILMIAGIVLLIFVDPAKGAIEAKNFDGFDEILLEDQLARSLRSSDAASQATELAEISLGTDDKKGRRRLKTSSFLHEANSATVEVSPDGSSLRKIGKPTVRNSLSLRSSDSLRSSSSRQ